MDIESTAPDASLAPRRWELRVRTISAALVAALLLQGCAATVRVREIPNRSVVVREVKATSPDADVERAAGFLRQGMRFTKSNEEKARGYYLAAASLSYRSLIGSRVAAADWSRRPDTRVALDLYRDALGRFAGSIPPGAASCDVETPLGPCVVRWGAGRAGVLNPADFDRFTVADAVRIKGIAKREREMGFGAAVTAIRGSCEDPDDRLPFHTMRGEMVSATLVAEFPVARHAGPGPVTLYLADARTGGPWRTPRGEAALDADFTLPIALNLDGRHDLLLGLQGLVSVASRLDRANIYMTEPYDPNRIPVLMIHGLQSSPLIWRDMISAYSADPVLRSKYQFWTFYYPSGLPILISASILRNDLADLRREFDPDGNDRASRELVLVGHSMGGILSRSLSADVGDRLWKQITHRSFEDLKLSPERKAELQKMIFFKADPAAKVAVFIATPHRGSNLARGFIGAIGQALVHLPRNLLDFQREILSAMSTIVSNDVYLPRSSSGITGLAPDSPMSRALVQSPFSPGMSLHSIIGDRGRGDTPNSSDGVVPYWSSHLDQARTELIVPTGHGAYKSPLAVEDVRRILLEYAAARRN